MKLKLMTYNIMSCRDYHELEAGKGWLDPTLVKPSLIAKVIKEYSPDIVGLNEVHDAGSIFDNQSERIAREACYNYFYFAKAIVAGESPYGNAVLSKYPIVEAETISISAGSPEEDKDCEARSIAKVVVDLEGQKFVVLVSHFGLADSEKQHAVDIVKKLVISSKYPCILMGDFNMTPDESLIQELKLVLKDTAPEKMDGSLYTYSSDKPYMKIDYIFVDKNITVEKKHVIESEQSDHKPYVAEVNI